MREILHVCRFPIYLFLFVYIFLPTGVGVYYNLTGERDYEQQWLDGAITYLELERAITPNPERREALDYTIKHYNKIGGFDVMFMPLPGCETWRVAGANYPWIPGITLDPCVMSLPVSKGAMILVHEAMHDGWFNLHPFVDAKMKRIGCL